VAIKSLFFILRFVRRNVLIFLFCVVLSALMFTWGVVVGVIFLA